MIDFELFIHFAPARLGNLAYQGESVYLFSEFTITIEITLFMQLDYLQHERV